MIDGVIIFCIGFVLGFLAGFVLTALMAANGRDRHD